MCSQKGLNEMLAQGAFSEVVEDKQINGHQIDGRGEGTIVKSALIRLIFQYCNDIV